MQDDSQYYKAVVVPEKIVDEHQKMVKEIPILQAKLKLAEKALEFYAEEGNWCELDNPPDHWMVVPSDDTEELRGFLYGGRRARAALEELRKG